VSDAGRASYERGRLDENDAAANPIEQFRAWFEAALAADLIEPSAMTLATVGPAGAPSARIVLLRGFDERGFAFFTNYESRKGRELEANGRAALVFWWGALERQIRIEGTVQRLPLPESDGYFMQRPRGHRLSAWASEQSTIVRDRAFLEERMRQCDARFAGLEIERPPYWGGYRVAPLAIEFWQGGRDRVHDRLLYTRDGEAWRIVRLSP
jgi:pyridoxamine 5'-phosphate oxidase